MVVRVRINRRPAVTGALRDSDPLPPQRVFGVPARLAFALAGSVALVMAFPPYAWWWTAPIGVAALAVSTSGASLRTAALAGALAGTVFFGGLLSWMTVVGVDAWAALTVLCAGWWMLLFTTQALVQRLRWWPVLVPALWVAIETLRSSIPLGGFPWGRLVFSQSDGPALPLAAIVGAPGITYLVALFGCLLAGAVLATERGRALSFLAGGALLLGVLGVVGFADDRRAWSSQVESTVNVAVVQGGVPAVGLSAMAERRVVLDNHARLTTSLGDQITASGAALDFVVWPESSTDIDPFSDQAARAEIDAAVQSVGVPVLVGAVVGVTGDPSRVANMGIVWKPGTGPGDSYVKRHPVPFGEYVPFRPQLGQLVGRFALVPRDFIAGDRAGVLAIGGATVGDVICYEVAYDGLVRDVVDQGAQVVVVQTNNATYGGSAQLAQQFAMSRVRAVEHGRAVLVAATSGISAIIEPDGSVAASIGDGGSGVLIGRVALRDDTTLATRWGATGEMLLLLVAAAAVTVSVVGALRDRRKRAARTTAPFGILRSGRASRS
jgi:apolipoprotein N-acyltransferase